MKTPFFPGLATSTLGGMRRSAQDRLAAQLHRLRSDELLGLARLFEPWIPASLLNAKEEGDHSRRRTYSLRNTFWAFLHQVMVPGISCKEVVQKMQACALAGKRPAPCSGTSAYCTARSKLPLETLQSIFDSVVSTTYRRAQSLNQWHGRPVKMVDATGLSMPDVAELQAAWPQQSNQKPGCGFPWLKVVGLFDLSTGMLIDWVESSKFHHESVLFQQLWKHFKSGDILLADRAYSAYGTLAEMRSRGVDSVMRLHQMRKADYRTGKHLGPHDRLITWTRPALPISGWSKEDWLRLPATMQIRMLRYRITQKGFRTRQVDLVTTLLDPDAYPAEDLAELFRKRWSIELFYRDIKITMGMDVLRTKSVAMIQKEIMMHAIAYNLVRGLMADVAVMYHQAIERISFKAVVDQLRQWDGFLQPCYLAATKWRKAKGVFYDLLASTLVPDRPGRLEPRARKRRPKQFILMNKPRHKMIVLPHR